MDELNNDRSLSYLLFADDVALVDKSLNEVNSKLKL